MSYDMEIEDSYYCNLWYLITSRGKSGGRLL